MLRYRCLRCGHREDADRYLWRCPQCGGPLVVEGAAGRPRVSLGEGNTPMVNLFGFTRNVHFKLEYLNPTGSFKDRGSAMTFSRLMEFNVGCVIEDSSGNAGISAAAYAAAAGLWATVVVPRDAPQGKRQLIKALGAELIEAEDREAAGVKARELESRGCAYIGHQWNPWFIKGIEGISDEIVKQLGGAPDSVVLPVSSGTLLLGIYYGFMKKRRKMPRLYGVQAAGCAPLYRKLHGEVHEKESALADALRVSEPPRLEQMAEAIRSSGGDVVVVNDQEITGAISKLLKAGAIVEPSSAAALAGYLKLVDSGAIDGREETVIVLTGSGLKYTELLSRLV
ncbi:MAG: pyridoxal-phosphate dependent enzyme [Conexivisphaera sp.]